MFQPEPAWLFELFRQDMDRMARLFRRQFFCETAVAMVTGYAAVQAMLDGFWGEPPLISFLKSGLWTAACLLWVWNMKVSFGRWREYRHYIK